MAKLPELEEWVAVGSATERSARLWFRSTRPGPLELELWAEGGSAPRARWPLPVEHDPARDGTGVFTYPDDIAGAPALAAARPFAFRIRHADDGTELGAGRFSTAPLPGASTTFSLAFGSCHQPWRADGTVAPRARAMLELVRAELGRRDVAYLVLLGDQIYADRPESLSMFARGAPLEGHDQHALPRQVVRAAYQRRYRQFCQPGFGELLSQQATYAIIDDHEVINKWGSAPRHRSASWQPLREGALDAAFDYQLSRNLPEARRTGPYHQSFRWGPCATFIADVRSERSRLGGDGQLMSETQLAALATFLNEHQDCAALFLGFSVPVVFLPRWFMRIGLAVRHPAAFDRWSWPGWKRQHDAVLDMLLEQRRRAPHQQLALLSGDVHQAMAAALRPAPAQLPIYQFVSSPLTNATKSVLPWLAHTASRSTRAVELRGRRLLVEPLPGVGNATRNPYGGLNIGVVDVDAAEGRCALRYRVLGLARDARALDEVFDSGWLRSNPGGEVP